MRVWGGADVGGAAVLIFLGSFPKKYPHFFAAKFDGPGRHHEGGKMGSVGRGVRVRELFQSF